MHVRIFLERSARKVSYLETTHMSIQSLKVQESKDLLMHHIYKQVSPVQNMHKICTR